MRRVTPRPGRASALRSFSVGNAHASRDAVAVILEGLLTTRGPTGEPHHAPLGAVWPDGRGDLHEDRFLLRPFAGSTTCANLLATRRGVWQVTDDARLLARAAVGRVSPPVVQEAGEPRAADCVRWVRFAVTDSVGPDARGRYELACEIEDRGAVRPWAGLNRAGFALVEGAILATRTFLLPRAELDRRLADLAPLITKTGTPADAEAWAELAAAIAARPAADG